jgi:hypothetical protein
MTEGGEVSESDNDTEELAGYERVWNNAKVESVPMNVLFALLFFIAKRVAR